MLSFADHGLQYHFVHSHHLIEKSFLIPWLGNNKDFFVFPIFLSEVYPLPASWNNTQSKAEIMWWKTVLLIEYPCFEATLLFPTSDPKLLNSEGNHSLFEAVPRRVSPLTRLPRDTYVLRNCHTSPSGQCCLTACGKLRKRSLVSKRH